MGCVDQAFSPKILSSGGATQRIGFFLHTPFPSLGVLATLPHSGDPLKSLCAYDLFGFQTAEELTVFHDAILRRAGRTISSDGQLQESLRGRQLIIGVDRLDNSKGHKHRFNT